MKSHLDYPEDEPWIERVVSRDSFLGAILAFEENRFWSKVDKSGPPSPRDGTYCWLWTAGLSAGIYGCFNVCGKHVKAHRFAYELINGPIPKGYLIDHRHSCPKICVNPAHLRLATKKQNMENLAGPYSNTVSGFRGVNPHGDKWVARIGHNGKSLYLGRYNTPEEANAAVVTKRIELFTHNDLDRMAV